MFAFPIPKEADMLKEIEKIKKASTGAMLVVIVILAYMLVLAAMSTIGIVRTGGFMPSNIAVWVELVNLIFFGAVCAAGILGVRLLWSVRADETPFTRKNVRRLKGVSMLLVGAEVWEVIWGLVFSTFIARAGGSKFFPVSTSVGGVIAFPNAMGGVIIVVGVLIYCVALVFQYGMALQQESDETL